MAHRTVEAPRAGRARSAARRPALTEKQAYQMGFRHVSDLADMNRVADLYLAGELDERALRLLEAWREGAMAASAMLDMPNVTVH